MLTATALFIGVPVVSSFAAINFYQNGTVREISSLLTAEKHERNMSNAVLDEQILKLEKYLQANNHTESEIKELRTKLTLLKEEKNSR